MIKKNYHIIIALISAVQIFSQSQFQQFISRVNSVPDSIAKSTIVDSFMNYARTKGIPFIEGNTANYIYRGNVSLCEVTGDFDEFNPYFDMTRLSGTNFFYYTDHYESNARLDYEFKINGTTVILDPENPDSLLGYYGYKSELAMPEYVQPWEIEYNPDIPHGTVIETSIFSSIVNRTYQLKIYLPPGYSSSSQGYPTAYFQDGFSYADWGSAINVLDNIIYANLIQPIIAVFVHPSNRNQEYAFGLRNLYRSFFINELVPFIENNYRTINQSSHRLVLGDSYGGNISALIAYNHPDVFGLLGLHSAALDPNDYEAYDLFVEGAVKNIKVSTIWGSYDNRRSTLNLFKNAIISKGYQTDWLVLPEGHSWGLWRATIDTMLQYFFPPQFPQNVQVTINTIPESRAFYVDGQLFSSAQIFNWQSGSAISISTDSIQYLNSDTRYVFTDWSNTEYTQITLTPVSDTIITANFSTEYLLAMSDTIGGSVTPSGGWMLEESQIQIQAIPDTGFYFVEWIGSGDGSYSGYDNPALIILNGPIGQKAVFKVIPINAPTDLTGKLINDPFSFELTWTDNSDNEDGFIIERESNNTFIVVDSVDQNVTSYTNFDIDSTSYRYRVKAFNQFTESDYSDTLDVLTPVELTSFSLTLIDKKVLIKWVTSSETNNRGFAIERLLNNKWQEIAFMSGKGNSSSINFYEYTDDLSNLFLITSVAYRLKQIDYNGEFDFSEIKEIEIDFVPKEYSLYQNYPNPFNSVTGIRYQLPKASRISLKIYDILGNEVATLVDDYKKEGIYDVNWDAKALTSGIYFYRLTTESQIITKKMTLLK